ncbi:alpha/beta hydrolase [Nonomuraea sp. NPDC046570]|uniref:alpha/beta fold hydrolase n=1 Tax=Nonomuraea sp. NPDC046570 TaxID=3155255 RepID=UPI0033FB3956
MKAADLSGVRHHTVPVGELDMHVAEQGEGEPVLLLHGFPELWYSWRHQLPALAAAGFRAIAPDQRGYGETVLRAGEPAKIEDFDIEHLTGDVVGLLDALDIDQAMVVGHDFGGVVAWATALVHPERVRAVAGLRARKYTAKL